MASDPSIWSVLLKSYTNEGRRRDAAQFDQHTVRKLADALKRRGVEERVLKEALADIERGKGVCKVFSRPWGPNALL